MYCIQLYILVFAISVLTACSTVKSARKNEAFKQPEVQQPAKRVKDRVGEVRTSTAAETKEQAGESPETEKADGIPVRQRTSTENTTTAIDTGQREGPSQTDEEKLSTMENKINDSLREFDEILLKKNREISRKKQQIAKGAGEGSTGVGSENNEAGDQEGEGERSENKPSHPGEEPSANNSTTTPSGPGKGKGTVTGQPGGIPNGNDDDVVARQLREAAEKETDPRLKKKLWEEYRRYKEG